MKTMNPTHSTGVEEDVFLGVLASTVVVDTVNMGVVCTDVAAVAVPTPR
jgi:hypothetical protein